MGAAAFGANDLLNVWVGGDTLGRQATRLLVTIVSALFVLAGSAHALRIREFREAFAIAWKRGGSEA
jgi:hypothetical protein